MKRPPALLERERFEGVRYRVTTQAGLLGLLAGAWVAVQLAPGNPGAMRWLGLAVSWWTGLTVIVLAVMVLAATRPTTGAPIGPGAGLGAAAAWLSAPVLLQIPAMAMSDGGRGLSLPVAVTLGAALALVVAPAAAPPRRGEGGGALALVVRRWGGGPSLLGSVGLADGLSGGLFLWAQFAAAREVSAGLGLPEAGGPVVLGMLAVALLAAGRAGRGLRLTLAVLGMAGVLVPLVVVMGATTPSWPRVFAEVASRPSVAFAAGSPWTSTDEPVRGPGARLEIEFSEEQRVVLTGRGQVSVRAWRGGEQPREVNGVMELTVRPGDRLSVPTGMRMRFEPGRAVPGAPETGVDWADPSRPGVRPGDLVALALTVIAGMVGLAPGLCGRGRVGSEPGRAGRPVAGGAVAGIAVGATLWALYTSWLAPEVYVGGVAALEGFGAGTALGLPAPAIRAAVALGMMALGTVAALGALQALADVTAPTTGDGLLPATGASILTVGLAVLLPVGPWTLLLASLGLSAAGSAPAVVLAGWDERATARSVTAGTLAGLLLYVALAWIAIAGPPRDRWWSWLALWPAVAACPAALGLGWLLRSRRSSGRGPLAPGLAIIHPLGPAFDPR